MPNPTRPSSSYVISHTCISWVDNFLSDWFQTVTEAKQMQLQLQPLENILKAYPSSRQRLFLLDYDGTLTR